MILKIYDGSFYSSLSDPSLQGGIRFFGRFIRFFGRSTIFRIKSAIPPVGRSIPFKTTSSVAATRTRACGNAAAPASYPTSKLRPVLHRRAN